MDGYGKIADSLASRPHVITNTDIDGVLCAALALLMNPDASVTGFCNSSNQLYKMRGGWDLGRTVMLDMLCKTHGMDCVDNHVIGVSPEGMDGKHNPNTMYGVSLENYTEKYPFSTAQLLAAVHDMSGLPAVDLGAEVGEYRGKPLYLWELFMRADDTLLSTFRYSENASRWWRRLLDAAGKSGITGEVFGRARGFDPRSAAAEKARVNGFLSGFGARNDGFGTLDDGMYRFAEDVFRAFGLDFSRVASPGSLKMYGFGQVIYDGCSPKFIGRVSSDGRVWSYAITGMRMLSISVRSADLGEFGTMRNAVRVVRPAPSPFYADMPYTVK